MRTGLATPAVAFALALRAMAVRTAPTRRSDRTVVVLVATCDASSTVTAASDAPWSARSKAALALVTLENCAERQASTAEDLSFCIEFNYMYSVSYFHIKNTKCPIDSCI
jgi:uncharacterized protein (DUF1501 family)